MMMSRRLVRGADVLKQGLRRSPPGCIISLREALPVSHVSTVARTLPIRSGNFHYHGGIRQQDAAAMSLVLHGSRGNRCFTGRPGEFTDGRRGVASNDEAKAPYVFSKRGGQERGSAGWKGELESNSAVGAKSADGEETIDFKNMTTWQKMTSIKKKMTLMWEHYGHVAVGTYTVLYLGGVGIIYVLLARGVVESPVDISTAMQSIMGMTGLQDNFYAKMFHDFISGDPHWQQIVLAIVANDLLEIPRDLVVIAVTPSIARALGKAPPKPAKKTEQ